jgi:hypothetical protein
MNSDNEDDMTVDQKRLVKIAKKKASIPRCTSAPGEKPPARQQTASKEPKGNGTLESRMRDDAGPSQKVPQPSALKAAASQKAPAGHTSSGQESPGTKVPPPTKASRAGSLRSVGGSGKTDTCVANGHPSKT